MLFPTYLNGVKGRISDWESQTFKTKLFSILTPDIDLRSQRLILPSVNDQDVGQVGQSVSRRRRRSVVIQVSQLLSMKFVRCPTEKGDHDQ